MPLRRQLLARYRRAFSISGRRSPEPANSISLRSSAAPCRGCRTAPPPAPHRTGHDSDSVRAAARPRIPLSASAGRFSSEQHVAEQLARGQQAPGRDDVLLALVLDVGGLAHEARAPRRSSSARATIQASDARPHHLDLVRPVLVLRRLQLVAQRRDPLDVLLRARRDRRSAPRRGRARNASSPR